MVNKKGRQHPPKKIFIFSLEEKRNKRKEKRKKRNNKFVLLLENPSLQISAMKLDGPNQIAWSKSCFLFIMVYKDMLLETNIN